MATRLHTRSHGFSSPTSGWIVRSVATLLVVLTGAACAPTNVESERTYSGQKRLPRPDMILVYDFSVSPDDVQLNSAIPARIAQLVRHEPRTARERALGGQVANTIAARLVKKFQEMGLPARRASGPTPTRGNVLAIQGQIVSIDQGKRARRMIIGFGAGRTDVEVHVQAIDITRSGRKDVDDLTVKGQSGRKPGLAASMGVGGLAGRLVTSAVVGAAVGVGSEAFSANVDADAKRVADKVTKQLREFMAQQGWVRAE